MRKLMWTTVGFGAVCALCTYGLLAPSIPVGTLLLAGTVMFTAAGRKWTALRRPALVFLGCTLALGWFSLYHSVYLDAAVRRDGQIISAVIRVSDYSYDTAYGTGVDGRVELDGKPYQVRAYLKGRENLSPGDEIECSFRFRVTTPDGAEEATYHAGKGIFLLAYQEGEAEIREAANESRRDIPARLRRQIQNILEESFPEDTAAFAKALLLGDTRDLSYEIDTNFKVSGIRHVVAVSGLHVSVLFALLSAVTFHKRFLTAFLGLPLLLLFASLAGFTPSVNRACIMAGLMLLALLADKEYDSPTALAVAALVMLIVNPLVSGSVSFQLSVASVAGIFLFNAKIHDWMKARLSRGGRPGLALRWGCTSVSVSLSAMTLTTPLCACYFGTVSLVGVLTNLLTLWLISFIFCGCMAVCLSSLISAGAAVFLGKIISVPIRFVLIISKILANFPLAAVYTRSPYIAAWLVFVCLLFLVFLAQRNKKPAVLGCCAVLGLCMALAASCAEPMLDDVRLTVLDVGQGQCLLLQSQGRTYMVDCGGDSDSRAADIAAETLLSQGITRLDGVILTHTDRDHAGGLSDLLTRVDTDLLILPPVPGSSPEMSGGQTVYAAEDLRLCYDNTVITIFTPQYPGSGNENSLCVLFETEKCDILITGDRDAFGERSLLRKSRLPDVDVLIAGHHGSKYSTCEELLSAVDPEIVCISAGRDNPYGHPAPELLNRLQGREVYRTDQNGTILIRR